jgi:hypothetical protein
VTYAVGVDRLELVYGLLEEGHDLLLLGVVGEAGWVEGGVASSCREESVS